VTAKNFSGSGESKNYDLGVDVALFSHYRGRVSSTALGVEAGTHIGTRYISGQRVQDISTGDGVTSQAFGEPQTCLALLWRSSASVQIITRVRNRRKIFCACGACLCYNCARECMGECLGGGIPNLEHLRFAWLCFSDCL
jgi:hypothetical protein